MQGGDISVAGGPRRAESCAGCEHLAERVAEMSAKLASHVAWAERAELTRALEKRLDDFIEHLRELRTMDEQARGIALETMKDELRAMNAIRAQLDSERGKYPLRTEVDDKVTGLSDRISATLEGHIKEDVAHHENARDRLATLEQWRAVQDASGHTLQGLAQQLALVQKAMDTEVGQRQQQDRSQREAEVLSERRRMTTRWVIVTAIAFSGLVISAAVFFVAYVIPLLRSGGR